MTLTFEQIIFSPALESALTAEAVSELFSTSQIPNTRMHYFRVVFLFFFLMNSFTGADCSAVAPLKEPSLTVEVVQSISDILSQAGYELHGCMPASLRS